MFRKGFKRKTFTSPQPRKHYSLSKYFTRDKWLLQQLRRLSMKYPPRLAALDAAKTEHWILAKNGNYVKRVTYTCATCGKTGLKDGEKQMDHIIPVADSQGTSSDWNILVPNIFTNLENWACLCEPCHTIKTAGENAERHLFKKKKKTSKKK